jgi:AcrR family transcriptional regulator
MSSTASEAGRRPVRRLSRAKRREAILESAVRAFAEGGFAATSMLDVAEASGVTQLIIYKHFESKETLYRAALHRVSDRLSTEWAGSTEQRGFGVGASTVLASAREDPAGFRLLWRHAAREPLFRSYASELREQATGAVGASLRERVPKENLQWASHATVGYLVEAVLNWLEYGDPKRDALFVKATNAAMRAGIRVWTRETAQ